VELLNQAVDFVLHIDDYLKWLVDTYGLWTYLILVTIVFMETGLVVTPFLPGDSLLFAAGALAGDDRLEVWTLSGLLVAAAVVGDNTNYWIGRLLGKRLLQRGDGRFLKRKYFERTHAFFEKYGTKAIILARFVPIVRTFMPFVAGVGAMTYRRFLPYDILGGVLWVGICVSAGYAFGRHEFVRENFSLVVLAIIVISLLPAIIEVLRHRAAARRAARGGATGNAAPGAGLALSAAQHQQQADEADQRQD
jgi:membrane-associated protein